MASATTDSSGPVDDDPQLPLSNNSVCGGTGSVNVPPSSSSTEVDRNLDGGSSVDPSPPAAGAGAGQPSPLNPKPGPTLRKFQKANSAATFLLDGTAYTIVATPPVKSPPISDVADLCKNGTGTSSTKRPSSAKSAAGVAPGVRRHQSSSDAGGCDETIAEAGPDTSQSSSSSSPLVARDNVDSSRVGRGLHKQEAVAGGEGGGGKGTEAGGGAGGGVEAPRTCCSRLRDALQRIKNEDITKEEVADILQLTIHVLEANVPEEHRVVSGDDDEEVFSNVEPEVVPTEVRDWLAMTFTRSNANAAKRKVSDIPKFRSVAHVIRAGILVDRIYRRQASTVGLQIPLKTITHMRNLDKWSFDVFAVSDASDGHALKYIGYELLQRYDLISKFKINIQTLDNFLVRMEQGYSKYSNPYHNLLHAADVAQTLHHVISSTNLTLWLSDLDVLSAVFAALIHDYEHTGTTNTFHINTSSSVALLYNDRSVLENHHLTATFRLLQDDDYNIVSHLKAEDYREFRSIVIDVVLATDMSGHFLQLKNMKNLLLTPDNIDKTKALALIVHCADISHPSKDWHLHERWTARLIEEFFQQGDREEKLGLQISPLCDRKNTLVAESQIGFIDFIVDPSMQVMGDMVDKIMEKIQERNPSPKERIATLDENSTKTDQKTATPSSVAKMERQWEPCLVVNRQKWKDRAASGWISPLQTANKKEADTKEEESSSKVDVIDPSKSETETTTTPNTTTTNTTTSNTTTTNTTTTNTTTTNTTTTNTTSSEPSNGDDDNSKCNPCPPAADDESLTKNQIRAEEDVIPSG